MARARPSPTLRPRRRLPLRRLPARDEPGCALREAVDPERLAEWRKLAREQARLDDRKAAARERKRSARTLGRQIRAAERAKRRR
jgi:hypothetical protein